MATGHQRSDGRANQTQYLKLRSKKLEEQRPERESSSEGVLHGLRVYIDGYIDNTSDLEMKELVTLAGGTVMYVAVFPRHQLCLRQEITGTRPPAQLTSSLPWN